MSKVRLVHRVHRQTLPKKEYGKCPFPDCGNHTLPGMAPHGLCSVHEKFLNDLLFILPHIKIEPMRDATALVIPGSREFGETVVQLPKIIEGGAV